VIVASVRAPVNYAQPAVADPGDPLDTRVLDELRASVGDDPAFVAELIDELGEEAPRQLTTLRETAAAGDAESARRAAHTLKGHARTFGAGGLAELCLEAETAAAAGDLAAVQQHLPEIETEWARVRDALAAVRAP
jgi:HPt (histidine-containing phosphotransfer) domain-containing protein